MDAVYLPFLVHELKDFLGAIEPLGIRGFSVTLPHKETILKYLKDCDPLAAEIGAVNTVVVRSDGSLVRLQYGLCWVCCGRWRRNCGCTEVACWFLELAARPGRRFCVGACRSAGRDLLRGVKIWERVWRVRLMENLFRRRALRSEKFDAIINATPVGMYPHGEISPLSARELNCRIVMDLIYRPLDTALLKIARKKGHRDGVGRGHVSGAGICTMGIVDRQERARRRRCAARCCNALRAEEAPSGRSSEPRVIQPDFREFQRLAKQGNLVPVYDVFSADLLTPVSAYLRIAQGARYSFLLESVEGGEKIARYTFAGAHPRRNFSLREWRVRAGKP